MGRTGAFLVCVSLCVSVFDHCYVQIGHTEMVAYQLLNCLCPSDIVPLCLMLNK